MIVRKVRNKNEFGKKAILTPLEVDVIKIMNIPIVEYISESLLLIAKKRKWKWYLERRK
jgi:hypothetical protein